MKFLRALAIQILVSSLATNSAFASGWGRAAAQVAGGVAASYVAQRAGGGTFAQLANGIAGQYLAGRIYDSAHQAPPTQSHASRSGDSGGGGYTYYSDSSRASYTPSNEEIAEEYAKYRTENTQIFAQAGKALIAKIKAAQQVVPEPQWICATICVGFEEFHLSATPIISIGNQAQATYDKLSNSCPIGFVFSNGLRDNNNGTQTVSLKESQLVCFPNKLTAKQAIDGFTNDKTAVKMRFVVTNVEIVGAKQVSDKFAFSLIDQLNNDPTILMLSSDNATSTNIRKEVQSNSELKDQINQLESEVDVVTSRDGTTTVKSKSSVPVEERITMVLKMVSPTKFLTRMEMPFSLKHLCGEEVVRVAVNGQIDTQTIGPRPLVSDGLVQLQLKAASFSEDTPDLFCHP